MRKVLSILLLAALGLPFFAALWASGQSAEAGLPACCRRNGAHHCAMSMVERERLTSMDSEEDSGKELKWKAPIERCPYSPASVVSAHPHDAFAPPREHASMVAGFSHPTGTVQTESKRRIARDRSRQKRGPPSFLG